MLKRTILNAPLGAVMMLGATAACGQQSPAQQAPMLDRISLPPGFSIEIYAEGLSNPRSMHLSPSGTRPRTRVRSTPSWTGTTITKRTRSSPSTRG
ncbi:MAG TPA: hypothetical protein EYQ82_10460 [Dehalococcoidia bacterium]|nr:hypothetical protein [Dehalococcoidia bacterium]